MTEADTQKDITDRTVLLVRGLMERRGFYWCYVAVKPSRFEQFQRAIKNKYNIQHFVRDGYGEVVVSGVGKEPPMDVTEKVAEIFNTTAAHILANLDRA